MVSSRSFKNFSINKPRKKQLFQISKNYLQLLAVQLESLKSKKNNLPNAIPATKKVMKLIINLAHALTNIPTKQKTPMQKFNPP